MIIFLFTCSFICLDVREKLQLLRLWCSDLKYIPWYGKIYWKEIEYNTPHTPWYLQNEYIWLWISFHHQHLTLPPIQFPTPRLLPSSVPNHHSGLWYKADAGHVMLQASSSSLKTLPRLSLGRTARVRQEGLCEARSLPRDGGGARLNLKRVNSFLRICFGVCSYFGWGWDLELLMVCWLRDLNKAATF